MVKKELSIIIVNWHSADYLQACVRSIYEHTLAVDFEVIVVDNASFEGCGEWLAREYPDVIFVQSQTNLGFARANNLGVQYASGRVLLFLNPDTEVRDRAIERLYEHLKSLTDPGVVGCRLLNSDGSLQTSCVQSLPTLLNQVLDMGVLQRWFPKSRLWGMKSLFVAGKSAQEVEAISGACMMIGRNVFDLVGGFSSDYFMYTEDLDLCFKTRCAGFRNYHINGPLIIHHGGKSSEQARSDFSNVIMRESVRRFLHKSYGGLYSGCYRVSLSIAAVLRLVLLVLLFPVWLVRNRTRRWSTAVRKWFAILRWGLGLERWTRRYEQIERVPACSTDKKIKACAEKAGN